MNKSEKPEKSINWSDGILARIKGIWPKFSIELSSAEYGPAIEEAEDKFGRYLVEKTIDTARKKYKDVPSIADLIETIHELKTEETQSKYGDAKRLYDDPCEYECMNGMIEIGWEQFGPRYRNKLLDLYGMETAKTMTARVRCACWRGPREPGESK